MFAQHGFGYAHGVDSDVQNPPGRAAADELKGLRALFRKAKAAEAEGHPGAVPAGPAAGLEARATPTAAGTPEARLARQPGPTASHPAGSPTAANRPAGSPTAAKGPAANRPAAKGPAANRPAVGSRLKADTRLRAWIIRLIVCLVAYLGFMFWLGWRVGLSAAVVCAAIDVIYRSRTSSIVPASNKVTVAQRYTRRRLKVLQPAGYLALNARTIPGTTSVIDHLVIGPAGVFSLDSELLDKRLTLRAKGGMLYHGGRSMEGRLDHAQEEADHAADLIAAELGQRIRVRPAMVIYGQNIPWVIMRFKGIDVFDGGRVGTYFRRQSKATRGRQLSASQIAMVHAAAERALPPLT